MQYLVDPVAFVRASRTRAEDDFWGGERSRICLAEQMPSESLVGLESFSHVEVVFLFHQVAPEKITTGCRHPRNNTAWPTVGIFAQRGKNRPNRIGTTICRLLGCEARELHVAELDAIDGTPILDVKPVMREFLPREPVRQPAWSSELMERYWLGAPAPHSQAPPARRQGDLDR